MSRPARSTSMAERIEVMVGEVNWMTFVRRTASFRAGSNVRERMESGKMERESQKRREVDLKGKNRSIDCGTVRRIRDEGRRMKDSVEPHRSTSGTQVECFHQNVSRTLM